MTLNSRPEHNLPLQLTCFIGRQHEKAEIVQRLACTRLLTLIGPAGCGKTRLALEAAAELHAAQTYSDGVWRVEVAAISNPALVPEAVAEVLGVRETAGQPLITTLAARLQSRHLLLLLDNCEHLITACARLAEGLLYRCPHLHLLLTSREQLHIPGEVIWSVPPFSLPAPRHLPSVDALAQEEAVQLFVDRAGDVLPTFALAEHNAAAIASICARLDGLPLAIELAAARIKVLSTAQIAARLEDRFRLLVNGKHPALPHHQSLKAALDWSYELLTEEEQLLLRRLSVLAGAFSLDTAELICADRGEAGGQLAQSTRLSPPAPLLSPSDILDLLSLLVDKSLVVVKRKPGRARCYRLLGTVRQYGAEKLRAAGEEAAARKRHLDWCLALIEPAESELGDSDRFQWLERLERDSDDLRAALRWSEESGDIESAMRLARVLGRFWFVRGYLSEGRARLAAALSHPNGARPGQPRARAVGFAGTSAYGQGGITQTHLLLQESRGLNRKLDNRHALADLLNDLGLIAGAEGDLARRRALHEESLVMFRELGAREGMARSLFALGNVSSLQGHPTLGSTYQQESLTLFRELEDKEGMALALNSLGLDALEQGDYAGACSFFKESLALFRRLDHKLYIAHLLNNLGLVALYQADYERALVLHRERLALAQEIQTCAGVAASLITLAGVRAAQGQPQPAARLLAVAETLHERFDFSLDVDDLADFERCLEATRAQLDEATFATSWAEGRAMTVEQAIDYAIAHHDTDAASADLPSSIGLTMREVEVLRLLATGKSNQEIAAELVLSIRTAERHIANIYEKIGASGKTARAAATAFAFSYGLIQR